LTVFIIYILSCIVNKFFFPIGGGPIDQHPHLALFRTDHHRLTAHATDHVKRIHRAASKRQLQGIFLYALFQRLSQIVGDLKKPVGRTQTPDALMRALVVVILDPQRRAFNRLLKTVKLRPLQKLGKYRLPKSLDLTQGHGMMRTAADMADTVFFHFLFEPGLSPPIRVLSSVVGEHLARNPVLGRRSSVGLQHVFGCLAAV
jgi:hypothetical protein